MNDCFCLAAAKVFEDRLVKRGVMTEHPDFEAVYHLVIDAVDGYNDRWEAVFKQQQQALVTQQMQASEKKPYRVSNNNKAVALAALNNPSEGAPVADGLLNADGSAKIVERRQMFMSEKEKKDELIQRQRAELAVKKGTAELDLALEKMIENEVLGALEAELAKLLADDSDDQQPTQKTVSSAAESSSANATTAPGSNPKGSPSKSAQQGSKTIASRSRLNPQHSSSSAAEQGGGAKAEDTPANAKNKAQQKPQPAVNIDDLFDLDAGDLAHSYQAPSTEQADAPQGTNDFAAELLYIMKTSRQLT